MKPNIKMLRRAALGAAFVVAGSAAPASAFLNSEAALNRALQFALRQVNTPGVFEIEVGRLTRPGGGVTSVDYIRLKDADGVWLTLDEVAVDWDARALLSAEFVFERLSAEQATVLRPPIPQEQESESQEVLTLDWPRAPVALSIAAMEIARLDLPDTLLPQALSARVSGAFSDMNDTQTARLAVERLSGPDGGFEIETRIDFASGESSVSIAAREDPGGLVAALTGLPDDQDVDLTVLAEGSGTKPPFDLQGRVGDLGRIDGAGFIDWSDDLALEFNGRIRPGDGVSGNMRTALEDGAAVTLDMTRRRETGAIALHAFSVDSAVLAVSGSGSVDQIADAAELALTWRAKDPSIVSRMISPTVFEGAQGTAEIRGRFSDLTGDTLHRLHADVQAELVGLRGDFGRAGQGSLTLASAPAADGFANIDFSLSMAELSLNNADLQRLLGGRPRFAAQGTYDPASNMALLESLSVEAQSVSGAGAGAYNLDTGVFDASLGGDVKTLAPIANLFGLAADGVGRFDLSVEGATFERADVLETSLRLSDLTADDPDVAAVLGETAQLSIRIEEEAPGRMRLADAQFTSSALEAAGEGEFSFPDDSLDVSLDWRVLNAAAISALFPDVSFTALEGAGAVFGALSAPRIETALTLSGLEAPFGRVAAATAQVNAAVQADQNQRFEASASLEGFAPYDPALARLAGPMPFFNLIGSYQGDANVLTIAEGTFGAAAASLDVSGSVDLDGDGPLELTLSAQAADLAGFSDLIGAPLGGRARLNVRAGGTLAAPDLTVNAEIDQAQFADYAAAQAALNIRTAPGAGGQPFDVTASLRGFSAPDPTMAQLIGADPTITLNGSYNAAANRVSIAEGRLDALAASLDVSGSADLDGDGPLELTLSAQAADLAGFSDLIGAPLGGLARLDVRAGGTLAAPDLTLNAEIDQLQAAQFAAARAQVTAEGDQGDIAFTAALIGASIGDPALDPLLGDMSVNGRLVMRPDADARIENLVIDTPALQARGGLTLAGAALTFDLNGTVRTAPLAGLIGPHPSAIFGDAAAFGLRGAADADAETLRIDSVSLTAPGASAQGSGAYDGASRTYQATLDVRLDDLSRAAGAIGRPIYGSLAGRVTAGGAVGGAVDTTFDVSAARLALGDPTLDPLLGDARITGAAAFTAPGSVDVRQATVRLAAAAFTASGGVDLGARRMDVAVQADAVSLAPFSGLAGTPLSGMLRGLSVTASGPFAAPRLQVSGQAAPLVYPPYRVENATFSAVVSPDGDAADRWSAVRFDADARAQSASAGSRAFDPLLSPLSVAAAGRYDLARRRLVLDRAQALGRFGRIEAYGLTDLAAGRVQMGFDVDLTDVSPLSALLGAPTSGAMSARGSALGAFAAPQIAATIQGRAVRYGQYGAASLNARAQTAPRGSAIGFDVQADAQGVDVGDPRLNPLIGRATLTTAGAYDVAARTLTLDQTRATAAAGSAQVSGTLDFAAQVLDLAYSASVPDLRLLADLAQTPLSGRASADGRLSGPITDPGALGSVRARRLSVADRRLGTTRVSHNLTRLLSGPEGLASLSAQTPQGPVSIETAFALSGDRLLLESLTFDGLGASLSGSGEGALSGPPLNASVTFDAERADQIIAFIGLPGVDVRGAVSGALTLTARGRAQDVSGSVTAGGLRLSLNGEEILRAARLSVEGSARDLLSPDPGVNVALQGAGVAASGVKALQAAAQIEGALSFLRVSASGVGGDGSLRFDGRATGRALAPYSARVEALAFTAPEARIALSQPLSVRRVGDDWRLEGLDLSANAGRVFGSAAWGPTSAALDLNISNMPLDLLRLAGVDVFRSGHVDGAVALSAAAGRPAGRFALSVSEVRLNGAAVDAPLRIDAQGAVRGSALEATVEAAAATVFSPARGSVRIPLSAGPLPTPDLNAPFSGSLTWSGDIAEIWPLFPAPAHLLGGRTTLEAEASGTLSAPAFSGTAAVEGGYYQNLDLGILMYDLTARAGFADGRRLTFAASASDGRGGAVEASGGYDLNAGALDASAELRSMTVLRRDDATAIISGAVAARTLQNALNISGRLTSEFFEFRLIGGGAPNLVVVEARPVGATAPPYEFVEDDGPDSPITLNLAIDIPRSAYVRGRGLESEWAGDLYVSGAADSPRIDGTILRKRGWFDLIGRQFDLVTGEARFAGGLVPQVNVRLQADSNGVIGWVDVVGEATNPDISFGSDPTLPEDEILPRLLFGRSKQSLSGFEAAQLAAGIATLMSGKPGALDFVRGAAGLDTLRVESSDSGAPTVSGGRYVADGVFVGARQNLETNETSALVEVEASSLVDVEVFDDIVIDAEIGASESEVGVNWKFDY